MSESAENQTSKFYNTAGWTTRDGITEDARRWEDLREHSRRYVSQCRLRVLQHIPSSGDRILDMASGPIQYPEYLEFSKHFDKRYCVDLSSAALDEARRKIGDHGVYLHGSFLDLPLEENSFDCAVSLHTIYHIDRDKQEEVVRKLLHVTRLGKPVVIVYSNPGTIIDRALKAPTAVVRMLRRIRGTTKPPNELYFYCHPIDWWSRFGDVADVQLLPWRSFGSEHQKLLIPDNGIGEAMLNALSQLEDRFPDFFVRNFQYPMIILTKRS